MSTMVMTGTRALPGQVRTSTATGVRLTRRGRLVVTLFLTVLLLAVFLAAGGASVATRESGDPTPIRTIEVQSGQTLWGIASEIAEPGEIRDMVYTIERLNSLPDAALSEGQI